MVPCRSRSSRVRLRKRPHFGSCKAYNPIASPHQSFTVLSLAGKRFYQFANYLDG
jgi:hypothetical protein